MSSFVFLVLRGTTFIFMRRFVGKLHTDAKSEKERHFVFFLSTLFSANKAAFEFHVQIDPCK